MLNTIKIERNIVFRFTSKNHNSLYIYIYIEINKVPIVKIGMYTKTRLLYFVTKACFLIFIIISDDRKMIAVS